MFLLQERARLEALEYEDSSDSDPGAPFVRSETLPDGGKKDVELKDLDLVSSYTGQRFYCVPSIPHKLTTRKTVLIVFLLTICLLTLNN